MTAEPLVSITIPTYNRPDYLKQALQSAVSQTYRNTEIIVSDNASPTSAQAIVESFNDPRIRFHYYTQSVTMFDNHIGGFRMATGKYVASLHDDDIWEPDFLSTLVPVLEADPDLIVAVCRQTVIDENSQVDENKTHEYNHNIGRDRLKRGVYKPFMEMGLRYLSIQPASSAVIRREAVDWDKIPAQAGPMWDVYLSYLLPKTGMGAYYCPENHTRYRIHSQSDTGQHADLHRKIQGAQNQVNCYRHILDVDNADRALSPSMRRYVRYRLQHAYTSIGVSMMKQSQVRGARQLLLKAMRLSSLDPRTWAAFAVSLLPRPSHRLRMYILKRVVKAN